MKGRTYPRPYVVDDKDNRRPIKGKSTWTYEFQVPAPDGRRRSVSKGGYATKTEADKALAEALSDHGRKGPVTALDRQRLTVAEFVDKRWFPAIEQKRRATTVQNYRDVFNAYLRKAIGGEQLARVTPDLLVATYNRLRREGGREGNALSATTVHRAHVTASALFKHALAARLISVSPVSLIADDERPAPTKRSPDKLKHWTPAQASTFVAAIAADRLFAMYVLTLNLGVRRSEVAGLRWGDVDLEAGTLTIRRGRTKAGPTVLEGAPKTTSSARTVELDQALVDVLRAHRARQAAERLRWGPAWRGEDDGHVFATEDGGAYYPDAITRRTRRLVERLDLPWIGFHGLRHSSATLLLAAGEQLKVVSERLGHSSTSITADLYQHVTPGLQRGASEKASRLLGLGS